MKFEVTILGSSAAIPTNIRNTTAQYVSCQNRHILIDCGEATQLQMRKFGVKMQRLDVILISHLHGDHFFGLVGLISTMRLLGRDTGLKIFAPKGLKEIILMQLELDGNPIDFEIEFHELNGDFTGMIFEDNAIEIHAFPLKHKVPTNGFKIVEKQRSRNLRPDVMNLPGMKLEYVHRIKAGEDIHTEEGQHFVADELTLPKKPILSYAFCSDTAYWETIVPHIKGVTALYHEATFVDAHKQNAKKTLHSTASEAARIAQMAEVKALYMGHLSARYSDSEQHLLEAKMHFENSVYVEDGMKIWIK